MPDLPFPGEAPPWGEKLNNALRQRFTSLINSLGAHTNATAHVHGIPDTSKLVHADDLAPAARAATTRGTLPSGTDLNTLDTLGGADEAGAWLMSGSYTYGNQPPRTPGATAVLEVVVANAYTGIIQRVTEASGATWARNKVNAGAGAWTTWRRMDPHVDTTVGTRVFVGDIMIYGDTGPRNLISGIPEGWTIRSDRIVLRRSGNWCSLQFGFMTQLSGQQTLYDGLPLGFRPDALVTSSALVPFSGDSKGRVLVSGQNITVTGTVPSAVWADVTIVWPTSDPWPTTLPGIPL